MGDYMTKNKKTVCILYSITSILQLIVGIINFIDNVAFMGFASVGLACTFACLAYMYYKDYK